MPAEPLGDVYRTKKGYGIRWRDAGTGARKRRSGFTSRTEAQEWFLKIERPRMRGETIAPSPLTLTELCEKFLEQHIAEPNTIRGLRDRLKLATDGIPKEKRSTEREHGMGKIRVDELEARTVAAWRRRLPEGSGWQAHKALRQVLGYAVRMKMAGG